MNFISIAKPIIGQEEKDAVLNVLDSGLLAAGEKVEQFEVEFAKYIGSKYAIATSSGTTALHLSMLSLGLGVGDEVITTPFSFIASANSILYTGAKPVFVDIEEDYFNIDPELIEDKITSRTKAILPVHLYGLPANMNKISKLAKKYDLRVIEDVCQAHGAKIGKRRVGSLGDLACFSFYPTKNMTTGEGGMVTTNDKEFAERVKLLRNHGMRVRYYHDILGYNFRMTNIAAAIGLEQLKKLERFNEQRNANAKFLSRSLLKIKGLIVPKVQKNYHHAYHQYTIRVSKDYKISRSLLIQKLQEQGVGTAIYYPIPIHKQKVYIDLGYKEKLPIAERIADEVLSLPIHPAVKLEDLRRIIEVFF